tara:strand:+ start:828 stop:1685 length:858 start_codon:yes stop_codon:yes gene_type:complete
MSILFIHTHTPTQTLEDETFLVLRSLYPQALIFEWTHHNIQNFHSFLQRYQPSLIISRHLLPRFVSAPNLIISSSLPERSLSWLFRKKVYVLSHSPQKIKHTNYVLPPLLNNSTPPINRPRCFLSIGPFQVSSNHHLALDAYAMLPKKIRSNHSLYFCGKKNSQEDIDRLKLHGYGLSISFIHDPIQTKNLLSHANIIFRLGDSTQKNLAIDRAILEYQHTAIHLKETPRTYLYPSQTCAQSIDPQHIKILVQKIIKKDIKDLGSPFDARSIHSKYTSLIHSLKK